MGQEVTTADKVLLFCPPGERQWVTLDGQIIFIWESDEASRDWLGAPWPAEVLANVKFVEANIHAVK